MTALASDAREPGARALEDVFAILTLEATGENVFCGLSPPQGLRRIFGGQILAQALVAAQNTVAGRACHSLHAYFLRQGNPDLAVTYCVERSRDGGSFSARRVVAMQDGKQIFSLAASFQTGEPGYEHQVKMPDAPSPEALAEPTKDAATEWNRNESTIRRPFEIRAVPQGALAPADTPVNLVWFRARGPVGRDPLLCQALLAYMSDMTLLRTSLLPHSGGAVDNIQVASIDHALWFHHPALFDDWLLYAQDSPSASGGRGFSRGTIFRRDGMIFASVAQEGLIRSRRA